MSAFGGDADIPCHQPNVAFDPIRDIRQPCASTPIELDRGRGSQTASASVIRFVIASGCEISTRWLALISIVFAPIRLAMKRSRSGLIVRSWVETAQKDGLGG